MAGARKEKRVSKDDPHVHASLFPGMEITALGLDFEQEAAAEGFRFIAGVDEVGRGCLAGAVVAAACILDPAKPLPEGLNDSKQIPQEKREEIAAELKASVIAWAVGQVEADEIDRINILQATKKAMLLAIAALQPKADFLLIDALQLKETALPQRAIIKGDSISASIAAASILAKTYRDDLMRRLDETYPGYGFASHVGYGTRTHWKALEAQGPCAIHRKSFKGVVPAIEPVELYFQDNQNIVD
jgi:ribonuclease HII